MIRIGLLCLLIPCAIAGEPAATWIDDPTLRTDRAAVIIAADTYQANATWNLPALPDNVAALQRALTAGADIPRRFQRVLRGPEVSLDGVRAALAAQAQRIDANGLLVVYWLGHGWIDGRGRTILFTHWTDRGGPAEPFTKCIARDELATLTDVARSATQRSLQALFVADVCRIEVGAPPPAGELVPLKDWEVYGTKAGEFTAMPGKGLAPFTAAWCEALTAAGRKGEATPLTEVFAAARAGTMRTAKQEPQLVQAAGVPEPLVARPPRVRVRVGIVDAVAQTPLATAIVEFSDGQRIELPGQDAVALVPGGLRATVRAPGCLPTTVDLQATLEQSGSRLTLPAHPDIAVITGTLSSSRVRVSVLGVDPAGIVAGLHRTETFSDLSGSYRLIIPGVCAGLRVRIGEREHPLPDDPAAWPATPFVAGVAAPTIHLGGTGNPEQAHLQQVPREAAARAPVATPTPDLTPTAPVGSVPTRFAGHDLDAAHRWPVWSRGSPVRTGADGAFELVQAGTPADTVPPRWLVDLRQGRILDATEHGTPRRSVPIRPGGGPARLGRVTDLRHVGVGRESAPLAPPIVEKRRNAIVDLVNTGAIPTYMPLSPPALPIERRESIVDLQDAGTPPTSAPTPAHPIDERTDRVVDATSSGAPAEESFTVPEALLKAMREAVQP